jgi:hypothetical protein
MQKGGGIAFNDKLIDSIHDDDIVYDDKRKKAFKYFLNNSRFEIFSHKTRGGIIIKAELNQNIESPYFSINIGENNGQYVKVIFLKLIFIGNYGFRLYKNKRNNSIVFRSTSDKYKIMDSGGIRVISGNEYENDYENLEFEDDRNNIYDEIIALNATTIEKFNNEYQIQEDIYNSTLDINLSPLCPAVLDKHIYDKRDDCISKLQELEDRMSDKTIISYIRTAFDGNPDFFIGIQVMEYIENSKPFSSVIKDNTRNKSNNSNAIDLNEILYKMISLRLKQLHELNYVHGDLHGNNALVKQCGCSIGGGGNYCCCIGYDVLIIDFGETKKILRPKLSINSERKTPLIQLLRKEQYDTREIEECIRKKTRDFIFKNPYAKATYKHTKLEEKYAEYLVNTFHEMYPTIDINDLKERINTYITSTESFEHLSSDIETQKQKYLYSLGEKSVVDEVLGLKKSIQETERILKLYKELNSNTIFSRTQQQHVPILFIVDLLDFPDFTKEQIEQITYIHIATGYSINSINEILEFPEMNTDKAIFILNTHKETNYEINRIYIVVEYMEKLKKIGINLNFVQAHSEIQKNIYEHNIKPEQAINYLLVYYYFTIKKYPSINFRIAIDQIKNGIENHNPPILRENRPLTLLEIYTIFALMMESDPPDPVSAYQRMTRWTIDDAVNNLYSKLQGGKKKAKSLRKSLRKKLSKKLAKKSLQKKACKKSLQKSLQKSKKLAKKNLQKKTYKKTE